MNTEKVRKLVERWEERSHQIHNYSFGTPLEGRAAEIDCCIHELLALLNEAGEAGPMDEPSPCGVAGHTLATYRTVEVGRHTAYVTRDMALDACEPAMEGQEMDGGPAYEDVCLCVALRFGKH